MSARIADIADLLVTRISGIGFPEPAAIERRHRPIYDLADVTDLTITVIPRAEAIRADTRGTQAVTYTIDIGVQKKIDTASVSAVDDLLAITEQIKDELRGKALAAGVGWVGIENSPLWLPQHLDQYRQFTSVISVTYEELVATT